MNKSIKKIILFFLIFLLTGVAFANEVEIFADNLEYFEGMDKIDAYGNVVLNWQDKKIYADYVEFVISEKVINACGNVKVEETGNTIHADSISYNYGNEVGYIKETFAYSSYLFMRSKSMERRGKNTFVIHDIIFSNCDLDKPHTYFRSKRCKLILGKRITIYNAVFYIGKIPVFYLPVVTKSLRCCKSFGSNLRFEIEPGYINSGVFSLKTAVSFSLSENAIGKIKYDCLGKKGRGYGAEINYVTDNAVGNIFAYTTKDLNNNNNNNGKKWQVRPNYFHRVNDQWTIRSKANFISDRSFNDFYNQSDWERTRNCATVTRQWSKANLLFGVWYNTSDNSSVVSEYKTSLISLPRVVVDIYAKNLGMGLVQKPYWYYSHDYVKVEGSDYYFFKNTSLFRYTLTKNFKLGRRLVLKPSLEMTENWYDKDDSGSFKNVCFTQYGGGVNARFRTTSWMHWNIDYLYKASNRYHVDPLKKYCGIEANCFKLSNYMYVGDKTTVRNAFECSLLHDTSKQRRLPLITELTWTPKYFVNVYAEEVQLVEPYKFNSFKFYLKVGELKKVYFNFGAFYKNCDDIKNRKINNIFGFGVWLTPKWRLDYNVGTTALVDSSYIATTNQELRLYRDLHCYNFVVRWRATKLHKDVFFKLCLKTNMPLKGSNNLDYDVSEEMFCPWEYERQAKS
ncbi:MAG: hypothetical protein LBQ13_00240 [Endomicrobium sp.]|jgi:LPS-assembly protein|nr:hypothetical protein [Endomicrobium sp.]